MIWLIILYSLGSKSLTLDLDCMCKKQSCKKTCLVDSKNLFWHFFVFACKPKTEVRGFLTTI